MTKITVPGLTLATEGIIRPDPFSFDSNLSVLTNTEITSANQITVTGTPAQFNLNISVDIGEYEINNSGTWTGTPGSVVLGDTVRVRHTSSLLFLTDTIQRLAIQGVIGTFTTRTIAAAQNSILWDEPAFLGYSKAPATSVTVPSVYTNTIIGEAPLAVYADASLVTAVGTNSLDGNPIEPFMHLDHRISATIQGGGAIPSADEITNPNTLQPVNMYSTGQVGGDAAFMFHNPDTYTVTLTSTAVNGTFGSNTVDIEVQEPTYDHQFIDGQLGNDVNDGNDALGLSLTSASFTHSTRTLSHASLANYDHAAATSNVYLSDNSNWIWLEWNGAASSGWFRIESKPTSTTAILAVSLGSDFSDVSSSDGPKATFNASGITDNTAYHFAVDQTYSTTQVVFTGLSVYFFAYGTGSHATLLPSTSMGSVFNSNTNQGPGGHGSLHTSRIHVDGNGSNVNVSTAIIQQIGQGATDPHFTLIMDRMKAANTRSRRFHNSGATGGNDTFYWDCDLDIRDVSPFSDSKAGCVIAGHDGAGSHNVVVGCRSWGTASEGPNLDHHYYITGNGSHRLRSYNDPRENVQNLNNVFNENSGSSAGEISRYTVYAHNRFRQCNNGFSGSNTQNDFSLGTFEETVAILNSFDGSDNFGLQGIRVSSTDSLFAGHNLVIGGMSQGMFKRAFDRAQSDFYLDGNIGYNAYIADFFNGLGTYHYVNSVIHHTQDLVVGGNDHALLYNPSGSQYIQDNQVYAPNDIDGDIYNNNASNMEDLATLNSRVNNSNNIELDPGFPDPASKDFRISQTLDVKFEVTTFNILATGPATSGTDTVALSAGFGVPKGVMIIQSANRLGTAYNSNSFCVGYSDGTNNIGCYVMNDSETVAQNVQECRTTMQQYASLRVQSNSPNSGQQNALTCTFQADQVTLNYDYINTEAMRCTMIVFGGDDISNLDVGFHDDIDALPSVNLGYEPDIVFGLTNHRSALQANEGQKVPDVTISHGVSINDGLDTSMALSWFAPHTGVGNDQANTCGLYNDAFLASIGEGSVENYTVTTSFTPTGITLTPSVSTGNSIMGYMAMKFNGNVNMAIVDTTIPTLPDNMTVTGVGFTPGLGFGYHLNGITAYNSAEDTNYSLNQVALDATTIRSTMNNGIDAQGAGDSGGWSDTAEVFQLQNMLTGSQSTGTDVNSSGHVFNSDGVTFTMTDWPANTVRGRMLFLGV